MNKKFDKKKYDIEYKKKNKRQFKVDLNIDEYEELNTLLKEKGLSKIQFVRDSFTKLKKGSSK